MRGLRLTSLSVALVVVGIALLPQPAGAAKICDDIDRGCEHVREIVLRSEGATKAVKGIAELRIAQAAGAVTPRARRRIVPLIRHDLALVIRVRKAVVGEANALQRRGDVDPQLARRTRLGLAAQLKLMTEMIAVLRGGLAELSSGRPPVSDAERAMLTRFARAAIAETSIARANIRRVDNTLAAINSDADLVAIWTRMRQRDAVLNGGLSALVKPLVPERDRISRRGRADVLKVFVLAKQRLARDFRARLRRASGLGPSGECRAAMTAYLDGVVARGSVLTRYAAAVRKGSARRVRTLFSLQRVLATNSRRQGSAAVRCLRATNGPRPAVPGSGSILPIDPISRSRPTPGSAASVQVVVVFPPQTDLEVRIFWPDGTLVPGFNGPALFPASLRTDARGNASASYGVVRGIWPTGRWRVKVNIAGRPDLAVQRTFEVVE